MRLAFVCSLVAATLLPTPAAFAQTPSHEEEVVRNTYAAISFLCGLKPVADTALRQMHHKEVSQTLTDQETAEATPIFEISHIQSGTIASIADKNWTTRFTVPEPNTDHNVILAGNVSGGAYGDETMKAVWTTAQVHWDIDNSFNPEIVSAMQALTVGQAVKKDGPQWTVPATYTRYATFQVTITFQGKTVGPYTASFFFGKDAGGKEIVAPQDAFGVGQLLWAVLKRDAYPSELLKSKLREQPALVQWVQTNRAQQSCSDTRSDLCCSHGRCALPDAPVKRDLATPISPSN